MLNIIFSEKHTDKPFFVVAEVLAGLQQRLGSPLTIVKNNTEDPLMHPGRYANIHSNGMRVGFISELHPSMQV